MLTVLFVLVILGGLAACVNSALYRAKVEARHPAHGELIKVNGHDVHVVSAGESGPVVLMIHGASANAREFEWSLAPDLSQSHRVYMIDRPGHGHSERPDDAESLKVQAAQAAGVLQSLAPGERAIVVGHSFGGAVSLRLALDHPELVEALVLLAPVTHDWGGGGQAWYNKYAAHPVIGPAFNQLVPVVGPAQVKQGINGVFHPNDAPEGYYEKAGIGLLFRPAHFSANARDVNALRLELAAQQERYAEIKVPTVVFSGAKDTVLSPKLHVGRLKHQITGLELIKLPEGGHMPHHSYREDVIAKIRALSRVESEA